MAGEWRQISIGGLCHDGLAELQTGPFGSQLHAHDYVADGVAVVPTEAIRGRQLDHSVLPRITSAKAKSLERHRLKAGDILVARRGVQATGHIGYVREPEEGFICGTGAIRLRIQPGNPEVEPEFLSHVLANPASVAWFKFHAIGATMPNLNEGIIRAFPLKLPPLPEQCAIAHILGTLDDKIELNRRMNETLEAMAQALFQSWFVDFDPVRGKAEGCDPSLPKPIADLFPDRFEDSELGEIPAGWRVGRLDEVLVLQRGFDLPTLERTPGPYPVIAASGLNGTHNQFMVRGPGVTTGRSGVLGNVFYIHEDFWPLNTSLWVKQFKHSTPTFAFHLFRGLDFSLFNAGSAVPTLNRNHVHYLPVVIPSMSTIRAFEDLSVPLLKRQKANVDESRTLVALRDMLLPELISGELRVKDAERFVEQAT